MVATAIRCRRVARRCLTKRKAFRRHVHVLSYILSPLLRYKLKRKGATTCHRTKPSGVLRHLHRRRVVCVPLQTNSSPVITPADAALPWTLSTDSLLLNTSGATLLSGDCIHSDSSNGCGSLVRQGSIQYIGDPALTPGSKPLRPVSAASERFHDEESWPHQWVDESVGQIAQSSNLPSQGVLLPSFSADIAHSAPGTEGESRSSWGTVSGSQEHFTDDGDDQASSSGSEASSAITGESGSDSEDDQVFRRFAQRCSPATCSDVFTCLFRSSLQTLSLLPVCGAYSFSYFVLYSLLY